MKKAIISVGMGTGQYEFIKRAKEKGFCVVAFGKGKNSEEAVKLADYTAEIDTTDVETAINWINELDVDVVGIGSMAGGRAIETVQRLSRYYDVYTSVPAELIIGNDKTAQMKFYKKFGLSNIDTWRVEEVPENISEGEYIVKPASGRGSEGIFFVDGEKLGRLIRENEIGSDDIVQRVVHGDEFRCLIFVQFGEILLLAPVLRKSYRDSVFLGRLIYDDVSAARIKELFEGFVKHFGIQNCVIKADVLVSVDELNVIEMDIGVGGGIYYQTYLSELYGRDLISDYIDILTGKKVEKYKKPAKQLVMDYVFNRKNKPVSYDVDECYKELNNHVKVRRIQTNALCPEKKCGYNSNADFIMTVIFENNNSTDETYIDQVVNDRLFS